MINDDIAADTFLEVVEEISSVELQIKLWLNIENDTGLISSFEDLMDRVDSEDVRYVVNQKVENDELKSRLTELLAMLSDYKVPKLYSSFKNDVYVVADDKWKIIRDFAKGIREKYEFDLQKSNLV